MSRPLEYLRDCGRRFGDVFRVRAVGLELVFFSRPADLKAIFAMDPRRLGTATGSTFLRHTYGERSVVVANGTAHVHLRRLLMPFFHDARTMRSTALAVRESAERMASRWPVGRPVPVLADMNELFLDTIAPLIGITGEARREEFKVALIAWLRSAAARSLRHFPSLRRDLGPFSPWRRFAQARARVDGLIAREIADRRSGRTEGGGDVIALLLESHDETGAPLSDASICDQVRTLVVAGKGASASAMTWMLLFLSGASEEIRERLAAEIDALGPDPDVDRLAALPFLDATCRETLRLRPVLPVVIRDPLEPLSVAGIDVRPGIKIAACPYLTHHREEIYPEPDRFRPARFLERTFPPTEFFPFGGGDRRCIGAELSLHEMKIVLATLASRVRLASPPRESVRPILDGQTIVHSGGGWVVIRERRAT
jgi:unspecific monooxygenase